MASRQERFGKSLCISCDNAIVTKNEQNNVSVLCTYLGGGPGLHFNRTLKQPIIDCNKYEEANPSHCSLQHMEAIAHILDLRALKLGKPGFTAPDPKDRAAAMIRNHKDYF